MSSLSRWDPIRDVTSLRDAMDQLFEHAVMRPGFPFGSTLAGNGIGQMNVLESDGTYYCQVMLPGVSLDKIDLTVRQNTLTIKADLPESFSEELQKKGTYLLREFGSGEYSRSITFPKDVDGDRVQAKYERGILVLQVPVAVHAQPKRITISEGTGSAQQPQIVEEGASENKRLAGVH